MKLSLSLLVSGIVLMLGACAHEPAARSVASDTAAKAAAAEPELPLEQRLAFFVNDVRSGRCEAIAPAIKSGLPIDGFDTLDQTPLIAAISHNHLDCARELLDHGANANLGDHAGWTPLIHAAYFGASLDLITLLLDRGADVNAQNGRGLTALYLASAAGHEPQVQLLLQHGANPSLASQSGYTPARVAQLRGLQRIVALLEANPAAAKAP